MSYDSPKKVQPRVLRESFEQAWNAADRAWEAARDTCKCSKPVHGITYLRVTRCARCGKTLRS